MNKAGFRLYAGKHISLHASFELAKAEARKHMPNEKHLRIEVLIEIPDEADWWAYDYEKEAWIPS